MTTTQVTKVRRDAIAIGTTVTGRSVTIGETQVVTFAGLTGDFFPLHMDAEAAAASPFGTRIAHGLLTFTVAAGGLAAELASWDVVAALGFDDLRFTKPVFFGDTITPTATVRDVSAKGDRGVVTLSVAVTNQRREAVVTTIMKVMVNG
jgi:Acyl dehydratase